MKEKKFKLSAGYVINILLLVTFVVTVMAPLTGMVIHKLASTLFLVLCIIHTIMYRKKLNAKRIMLLVLIAIAFLSGIFGMVFDEIRLIGAIHTAVSIAIVFFLAIHIFIFNRSLKKSVA